MATTGKGLQESLKSKTPMPGNAAPPTQPLHPKSALLQFQTASRQGDWVM